MLLDDLKAFARDPASYPASAPIHLCSDAAAEIERLRQEVAHWKAGYNDMKEVAKSAIGDFPG